MKKTIKEMHKAQLIKRRRDLEVHLVIGDGYMITGKERSMKYTG